MGAGVLVGCGLLHAAYCNFLRSGHTHEDIDMTFASLARHIAKQLCLQVIDAFASVIQYWLEKLPRPYEAGRFVCRLDRVRNWKEWLAHLGKKITGIFGPRAPHVFEFIRRESLEHDHPLRVDAAGKPSDVVVRCKQFMCDSTYCAECTYITRDDIQKLPTELPQGPRGYDLYVYRAGL